MEGRGATRTEHTHTDLTQVIYTSTPHLAITADQQRMVPTAGGMHEFGAGCSSEIRRDELPRSIFRDGIRVWDAQSRWGISAEEPGSAFYVKNDAVTAAA
jgi:hypothetical protein